MKVKDLPTGECTLTIRLRNNGEKLSRLEGKVVEIKGEKHFVTPVGSFAPNTQVTWRRKQKEVKKTKSQTTANN